MDENDKIIKTLPEPYRSAFKAKNSLKYQSLSIDFRVNRKKDSSPDDHIWLEERGYEIEGSSDSYYFIKGLYGFNPSSYGWGTFNLNSSNKTLDLFCQMYKEGIIKPFRIGFYMKNKEYDCSEEYHYEDGRWRKYDVSKGWIDCFNPLFLFEFE